MNEHIDNILKMKTKINNEKISITPSTMFDIYYKNEDDDIFYTFYQNKIGETKKLSKEFPIAFRIGINTEKLQKDNNIIQKIYDEFIYYMHNIESLNNYYENNNFSYFPNNVIMIETLVCKENKIETHVVAVLKYNDNDFYVYDPTQSSFGKNMTKNFNELCKISNSSNIFKLIEYNEFYKIPQYDKNKTYETGYSTYDENYPKYRDCIDIAVKISFYLNELQKQNICKELFSNSKIISELSNNKKLNDFIINFKYDYICLREIQSSCPITRSETKKFLIENKEILKKYCFYNKKSIEKQISD